MRYSVPDGFRDADAELLSPELRAQIKLSVLLGYGFALSLLVLSGAASFAAFVIGLVALNRIRRSGGRLVGLKLAWWCIAVDGLLAAFAALFWAETFKRW